MSLLSEFEKVKNSTLILSFISILLLFTPGTAFIFLFNKDLFLKLDFLKILLLSLTIISPFILLNFAVSSKSINDDTDRKMKEDHQFYSLILSIILSSLVFYFVLILSFFLKKDFWTTSKLLFLVESLVFISMFHSSSNKKK